MHVGEKYVLRAPDFVPDQCAFPHACACLRPCAFVLEVVYFHRGSCEVYNAKTSTEVDLNLYI